MTLKRKGKGNVKVKTDFFLNFANKKRPTFTNLKNYK